MEGRGCGKRVNETVGQRTLLFNYASLSHHSISCKQYIVNNTLSKHEIQIIIKLHFIFVFHCPFIFSGGNLALPSDDNFCVSNYLFAHLQTILSSWLVKNRVLIWKL